MKRGHEDLGGELSGQVIAAAISVHRELGPGFEEAVYEQALHIELIAMGIENECQVPLPLIYKGVKLDCGYRLDLFFPDGLLIELKAVEKIHPIHEAQLITYLRLAKINLGLLMNFGALLLRDGIVRRANSASKFSMFAHRSLNHDFNDLSYEVIDAALEVQHFLGPGLLRSAYEVCLAYELGLRGIKAESNLPTNLVYRERPIPTANPIPMLVNGELLVACHCVKQLERIHLARQRSLLKAGQIESGLCLNFHSESMATEVKRISTKIK